MGTSLLIIYLMFSQAPCDKHCSNITRSMKSKVTDDMYGILNYV